MSQTAEATAPIASTEATKQLPAIGSIIHGGYFAGQIMVDGILHGLVMAGAAGELSGRWNSTSKNIEGALSRNDGLVNTKAMAAAGSKLAERTLALNISGFTDWYIPSVDELEMLYRAFKPSSETNYAGHGVNGNSIPAGVAYTRNDPAQTTVQHLIEDEADALIPAWYWSSTQSAPYPDYAWGQNFVGGDQDSTHKSYAGRARAVRRFVI